jgi:hypothetical protein
LPTWTPAALSRELRQLAGRCWRVVEAQHVISTMKLVDTLAEQQVLEELLEATKPPVPPECASCHYLLSTPFRYGAPYPGGSRFRRAGHTPGVFYASDSPRTAIGEMAFRRMLFFAESPTIPWPVNASEYTVFAARVRTKTAIDLTAPPLSKDADVWTHPTEYAPCQAFADAARHAGAEVLRYRSARVDGRNFAILTCRAFPTREPVERQTWRMHVGAAGARAIGDFPDQRLSFDRAAFARDPRIASLRWDR